MGSALDRMRGQRLALVKKAGEAGLMLVAQLATSQDPADAKRAVAIAKGTKFGWWPELAPLNQQERAVVREQVALGFARYVAEQAKGDGS